MNKRPRFGGAFFYKDANALCAFKSRGFGGEIGLGAINAPLVFLSNMKYATTGLALLPSINADFEACCL